MAEAKEVPPESFPLEKVIDELRGQLKTLSEKAGEKEFTFSLDEVEVELQVGLTAEIEGKIGFNCWIYKAEATPKIAREGVQTIRLKMRPPESSRLSKSPKLSK